MNAPIPAQLAVYRKQLEFLVVFSNDEWNLFASHLYLRELKKKEKLVTAGGICHEIGFIVSGSMRFFIPKDGLEISNFFCFHQELVTSYSSFLKGIPSFCSIEALEDCEIICFDKTTMEQLQQHPLLKEPLHQFRCGAAEYLVCCYEDRLVSFMVQSPEERYLALVEQAPHLLQRIPQHLLANFLGITPVSLSRIRKRIFSRRLKTA